MRLQDRVGLRLQGGPLGNPRRRRHRLRVSPRELRRASHRRVPGSFRRPRHLPRRQGFSSVEWERQWLEEYGALVAATPQNSAQRAWPEEACRWAAGKRQLIEGVIWQLKDYFGLERHRAKTLSGLLTRLAAKVAAYIVGQVLNDSLGRPLRHLADLLV